MTAYYVACEVVKPKPAVVQGTGIRAAEVEGRTIYFQYDMDSSAGVSSAASLLGDWKIVGATVVAV